MKLSGILETKIARGLWVERMALLSLVISQSVTIHLPASASTRMRKRVELLSER